MNGPEILTGPKPRAQGAAHTVDRGSQQEGGGRFDGLNAPPGLQLSLADASTNTRTARPAALILSQVYAPDVVAAAQHVTEYAEALAVAGWRVRVLCSRRAYDQPGSIYPARDTMNGVEIVRLLGTGLGKGSKLKRAMDFGSWMALCAARLVAERRTDVVVALTVPPLVSYLAAAHGRWRRIPLFYWIMDLNPDEAVAAGWLKAGGFVERVLSWMLRRSLRQAQRVIVLDHFMHRRICAKGVHGDRLAIVPPWSHDHSVEFSQEGRTRFRREQGWDGKFVVMYSGNHSPCHPLDSILAAALALRQRQDVVFAFVGGGAEFSRVKRFRDENGLSGITCLPYQPLSELSASLSSADLHCVVMGDPFVGMIHPCKIYNILRLGLPFAYIGPERSHVAEILSTIEGPSVNGSFRHGQVRELTAFIASSANAGHRRFADNLRVAEDFSARRWVPTMVNLTCQAAGVHAPHP